MITEKYSIVCNVECLLKIFDEYDNKRLESENPYDLLFITQFYNLFTANTYLVLDKEVDYMQNPYLKKLILKDSKLKNKVSLAIRSDLFEEENYLSMSANTVFIMNENKEICKKLEENYGMLFISRENMFERAKILFSWALYNVTKNEKAINKFKNWGELQNFRHPLNAMVVVDNFILDTDKSKDNLIDLLNNFLPHKLEKQIFDLTIITNNQKRSNNTDKQKYNLNNKYKEIDAEIRNLRSYQINISLIIVDADKNHDRNIFTNYFWLHSGHSFDYFSEKSRVTNPTNLMIFSVFYQQDKTSSQQNSVYEAVYQLLQEIKLIVDNTQNTKIQGTNTVIEYKVCGNKQNRLLP